MHNSHVLYNNIHYAHRQCYLMLWIIVVVRAICIPTIDLDRVINYLRPSEKYQMLELPGKVVLIIHLSCFVHICKQLMLIHISKILKDDVDLAKNKEECVWIYIIYFNID